MRLQFLLAVAITGLLSARPAQSQWLEIRSPHFRVLSDGGERRARDTALDFEQMRSAFAQVLPENALDDPHPLLVVALKNDKELSGFAPLYKGKPVKSAGLCQTGPDGNVILIDLLAANRWQTVVHEYGHILISRFRDPPAWFNEGFAGYFSSIRIFGKDAVLGRYPEGFAQILGNEKLLPISTLFRVTHDSPFYNDERGERSLFYAESWLVVHYLWSNHLEPQLLKYLGLVQHNVPFAEAIQNAFAMTPAEFDKTIERYRREGPKESRIKLPEVTEKVTLASRAVPQLEAAAVFAGIHLHEHDYEEQGIRELQEILKQAPDNFEAHRGLGYAYYNRHDFDQAMLHLDQAAGKNPDDWQIYYYQAMVLSQRPDADAEKMEKVTLRLTELNPGFAAGYSLLGFALMTQHKSPEATVAYEKALKLNPGNEADTLNLAELYSLQNRLADAKPLFLRLQNSANETIARAARSHLELLKPVN